MKPQIIRQAVVAACLPLLLAASGCASWDKLGREYQQRYGQPTVTARPVITMPTERNPGLAVLSWSLTPESPAAGNRVSSDIQINAYPTGDRDEMLVTVSRILHLKHGKLPLGSPRTEVMSAGSQLLHWNFTLPVDADPGEYTLETRIVVGDYRETVNNGFVIR